MPRSLVKSKSNLPGRNEVFYEDEKVEVIVPKSQESAKALSRGTVWWVGEESVKTWILFERANFPFYIVLSKLKDQKWMIQLNMKSSVDERGNMDYSWIDQFPEFAQFFVENEPLADQLFGGKLAKARETGQEVGKFKLDEYIWESVS